MRILNLREEKKNENGIVHGPQNEGENSKLNNITHQIRHWPSMVGGEPWLGQLSVPYLP